MEQEREANRPHPDDMPVDYYTRGLTESMLEADRMYHQMSFETLFETFGIKPITSLPPISKITDNILNHMLEISVSLQDEVRGPIAPGDNKVKVHCIECRHPFYIREKEMAKRTKCWSCFDIQQKLRGKF